MILDPCLHEDTERVNVKRIHETPKHFDCLQSAARVLKDLHTSSFTLMMYCALTLNLCSAFLQKAMWTEAALKQVCVHCEEKGHVLLMCPKSHVYQAWQKRLEQERDAAKAEKLRQAEEQEAEFWRKKALAIEKKKEFLAERRATRFPSDPPRNTGRSHKMSWQRHDQDAGRRHASFDHGLEDGHSGSEDKGTLKGPLGKYFSRGGTVGPQSANAAR